MTIKLSFGRDVQGYNSFAPPFSQDKYSATLAAAGHNTITVPSNFESWIVAFSYQPGATIWVSVNGTAAAPAGATFAATTSQLNPGSLHLKAADVIDLLNDGAGSADVGVIMFADSYKGLS